MTMIISLWVAIVATLGLLSSWIVALTRVKLRPIEKELEDLRMNIREVNNKIKDTTDEVSTQTFQRTSDKEKIEKLEVQNSKLKKELEEIKNRMLNDISEISTSNLNFRNLNTQAISDLRNEYQKMVNELGTKLAQDYVSKSDFHHELDRIAKEIKGID